MEEKAHAMRNKDGIMCENVDDIKQIHKDWFQELLKTNEAQSEAEKQAEEIVDLVWNSMVSIANSQPPRETTREETKEIVHGLDPKKAKDADTWQNKIIKEGGDEMIESLTKIMNQVDRQRVIPFEWIKMEIKAIHKAGERCEMKNKRGLFLTNNVSKIYEKNSQKEKQ